MSYYHCSNTIHFKPYFKLGDMFIMYFTLYFLNFKLYVNQMCVANSHIMSNSFLTYYYYD